MATPPVTNSPSRATVAPSATRPITPAPPNTPQHPNAPGGANAPSDSPGSKDYAGTHPAKANIGAPGTNRTVVGDEDSAAGEEPIWPPSEHETIAEEQRRRSEQYVEDMAKFAEQQKRHAPAQAEAEPTKA